MRVFGIDAALKFNEIAKAVLGFAEKARDFLVPVLQKVGDFVRETVIPALGELFETTGVGRRKYNSNANATHWLGRFNHVDDDQSFTIGTQNMTRI
jgi:hypothetical protein